MTSYFFATARLSALGLGLSLLLIVIIRTMAICSREFPTLRGSNILVKHPMRDVPEPPVLWLSACVALFPLFAFIPRTLQNLMEWPGAPVDSTASILSIWAVNVAMLILIDRTALDKGFKLTWAAGWIAFSHALGLLEFVTR